MDWDDLPPIEAPKTALPRRKGFLNFGDSNDIKTPPKTAGILKNDFDFPPINTNEANEKHISITESKSNDNFENKTQNHLPSRLLLSGSLSSDVIQRPQRTEIIRPILQQTSNPPVDDIFAENGLSESIFPDKPENKQEDSITPRSSSLFNRQNLIQQDSENNKIGNFLSQSDIPQSTSESEFTEIPKNVPPRLARKSSLLSNIGNREEMNSAPVPKLQNNETSDIFKQESASFFSDRPEKIIRTPLDNLEKSLCTSFNRSFASFKRSVSREIINSIRPTDNISPLTFDNFINDLVDNVKSVIDSSESVNTINTELINNTFTNSLNDGMKPIRRLLAEIEQKQISEREKRKNCLSTMNENLNILYKTVKDMTDSALKELDTLKVQTIIQKENRGVESRINASKIKTLKLRASDYETRAQHQIMELESVEKMMKQTENAAKELENMYKTKQDVYCEKIKKEIQTITGILESNDDTDLCDAFTQMTKRIVEINNTLSTDINEFSNMFTAFDPSKIQFMQRMQAMQCNVSAAETIYEKRRFRELSKREFNERTRVLQENDSFFNSMY